LLAYITSLKLRQLGQYQIFFSLQYLLVLSGLLFIFFEEIMRQVFIILFLLFPTGLCFGDNEDVDEEDIVYSYHQIYGCKCFKHCICFSHYSAQFSADSIPRFIGGFPPNNAHHPTSPSDNVWHAFMNNLLLAKKTGPYIFWNEEEFTNFIGYRRGNELCMLSDYLNLIEAFKKNLENEKRKWANGFKFSDFDTEREYFEKMASIEEKTRQTGQILDLMTLKIIPLYKKILQKCPHSGDLYNLAYVHNQGLVSFLEGDLDEFMTNADQFIKMAFIHKKPFLLDSSFYQRYGEGHLQVGRYHKAIEALSTAIEKDPKNKEAYFQRAIAYFEIGNFDQALLDYLLSEKSKGIKNIKKKVTAEFYQALLLGLASGGKHGLVDFFPSLWHSAKGIGQILWIFAEHPVNSTVNFANICYEMASLTAEFLIAFDWDTAEEYAAEFRQLMENFDSLPDAEKGHLIGYNIGKYGLEIFAGGTAIKGVSAFKKLKEANRLCNFEALVVSNANKENVLLTAFKYEAERDTFFKNAKIHWDRQNKHIQGKHNYIEGRSIFTHPDAQKLLDEFAGLGEAIEKRAIGCPDYRERINFGEIIGYHYDLETKVSTPTMWGEIRPSKSGAHIVPIRPR
jgi:tetratricopeptide (TPR) repeat protein